MVVFVSYTMRDFYVDRQLLESIAVVLSEYGNYYIDLLHNNSTDWQSYVEAMLSKADFILLIASDSISESEWVQWELSEAKKSCIPIVTVQASRIRAETITNLKNKMASEFHQKGVHRCVYM